MEKFNWDSFVAETAGSYMTQAYRWLQDREEAEDVVQKTYLDLFRRYDGKSAKELDYIGFKMIRNMCLANIKDKHRSVRNPTVMPFTKMHSFANIIVSAIGSFTYQHREHDYNLIISTLQRAMKPHHYNIVMMSAEGRTNEEVARELGISRGTVSSTLHYAKKKVHKLFPNYFS